MDSVVTPALAHKAFTIIFGSVPLATLPSVLSQLTQKDLASRFRSMAMDLHPDRAGTLGKSPDYLEKAFKRLHGAYRLLSRVLEDPTIRTSIVGATSRWYGQPGRPQRQAPNYRRSANAGAAHRSDGARFYAGRVPEAELRFAQFLYYSRVIDWKTMIDAITWQYRVRPKVGEIGRAYRFLDFDGISLVLRSSPRGELFGDTAIKLGVLDRRQINVVLGKQHQLNYPIGRYFVEQEILSRPEVEHLLQQNRRHNVRARNG